MKVDGLLGLLLVAALTTGCREERVTVEYFVPDVSDSITQQGSNATWRVLDTLVKDLHRGDSLVVVPITSDAGNDVSGRSLLITAKDSRHREALDEDMDEMRAKATQDIETLQRQFRANPGADTDLLGTFQVISEEVRSLPHNVQPVVIVFSDFIQDDRQFNFRADPRLESPERATIFASALAKETRYKLNGAFVYLGYIESRDLATLSRRRRQALTAFWLTFLAAQGAQVSVATNGPGSVMSFLNQLPENERHTAAIAATN